MEQQRLWKEQNELQKLWDLQMEKVTRLRKNSISEAGAAVKFQLDQQIEQEVSELKRLGDELRKIETELASSTQEKIIAKQRVVLHQAIPSVPVWKGRDEILKDLKIKLLQVKNPLKVLALIGQGGIGKTSLMVKLLEALDINLDGKSSSIPSQQEQKYQCVMYFKTLEGTSFDDVAEFLLKDGLGIQTTEVLKTPEEKISRIIQGLAKTPCLVVLDNLESILQPGNHPQAGRTLSPEWGKLLSALAYQQHQSQTILTSRELPADLADTRYANAEPDLELVEIVRLGGVATAAGVEILQQRQLRDSIPDLWWISQQVDGHLFLLTQLAAIGKAKPGYLRKHRELVTQKTEPILREQLSRQNPDAQDLLKRMCVLRVGIDIRGLTFLRLYTNDLEADNRFEIAAMSEQPAELTNAEIRETETILERLVDSSLVQSRYDEQKYEIFYDLHPVIVDFLQVAYKDELPNLIERVYKFYCSGKNIGNPQILEDLRPVLESQYFSFQLGNYDEASRLVMWTLNDYLRRWGYWNLLKDLYEQILPKVDEDDYPICLRQIGRIYRDFGNWDIAEKYFYDALSIEQKKENKSGMASGWASLGNIEFNRGNWDAAETLYRQSLEVKTELGDRSGMAMSIGSLGETELGKGNLEKAEKLLKEALEKMQELGMTQYIAEANYDLAKLEVKRGNIELAQQYYNTAHQIFQKLGAAKDLEKIEREWKSN